MNPLDSYECDVCGRCFNGDSDISFGPVNERGQCEYLWCQHGTDTVINREMYHEHMNTLLKRVL